MPKYLFIGYINHTAKTDRRAAVKPGPHKNELRSKVTGLRASIRIPA